MIKTELSINRTNWESDIFLLCVGIYPQHTGISQHIGESVIYIYDMERKIRVKDTYIRFSILMKYRYIPHSVILKKSKGRYPVILVK